MQQRLALLACAAGAALALNNAYVAPGAVGFTPGGIAAVRLQHPQVQSRFFSLTTAVWVDEFVAPTDPNAQLVLKQSISMPNTSAALPPNQYRMTVHGQDLTNLHDMVHGGIVSLAGDNAAIIFSGFDSAPGSYACVFQTAQFVGTGGTLTTTGAVNSTVVYPAYSWVCPGGFGSFTPAYNLVAGHLDYNAMVDVSSIAAFAGQVSTGGFLYSSSAPCTPGLSSCTAGGYLVDANAYIASYICGPWWVPYGNALGFTQPSTSLTSGNGAFSYWTGCSSTGGARTIGFVQGRSLHMYYYSSSQLMYMTVNVFPPTKNVATSATTLLNPYVPTESGDQGEAMGYRQWIFTSVIGGCQACAVAPNAGSTLPQRLLYLLADAGLGLRVMQSAGSYPSLTVYTNSATDMQGYLRVPNNDQALIGVTVQNVAGRTVAYASSQTGNIYSFDLSSLTWNNNGFPVYKAGLSSSYRGMVQTPRPIDQAGQYCQQLPFDTQTAGSYIINWANGYALASTTTTGATWGTQAAPIYATASFGCYAGNYSTSYSTIACNLTTGWATVTAPTCTPCTAAPGSYCPPLSTTAAGVVCTAGFACAGGATDRVPCTAQAGYYCAAGASSNTVAGWTLCAAGFTCLGGTAQPRAVVPFQPNSAIVVRLGDSMFNYGANTQPVFLDEYDSTVVPMVLLQSVLLPVVTPAAAGQNVFSMHPAPNGYSSPGFLSLSADQRFLTLAGYAAPPNTPLTSLYGSSVPRVIARIDWNGNVDTSTTTVYGDSQSIAFGITSACTYDGSSFVFTGDYMTLGNTSAPMLPVNFQPFGSVVTSLAAVQTFTSPTLLARSTAVTTNTLASGYPIFTTADQWHQCQYNNNQLLISHTWGATGGISNFNGDLHVPNFVGMATAANLNADFSNRYTWSASPKGAMGFTFFDGGHHLALCDRGTQIAIFNDPTTNGCAGSSGGQTTSIFTMPGYSTATASGAAPPPGGIADQTNNCFAMAASRDGSQVWFTTDTAAGFSRVFKIYGWNANGAAGAATTYWSPTNDWYYSAAANGGNDNIGGIINTYWSLPLVAQPILKGIAQTPQPAAACATGGMVSGGTCSLCPANTFSATTNAASCTTCASLGMYSSSLVGSATCVCNPGFTSTGSGATLACTCPAGSILSGGVCTPCAVGTFAASTSASSCSPCAANTYSASLGMTSCPSCPPGALSSGSAPCACNSAANFVASGSTCVCAANTSSLGTTGSNLACTPCPPSCFSLAGRSVC